MQTPGRQSVKQALTVINLSGNRHKENTKNQWNIKHSKTKPSANQKSVTDTGRTADETGGTNW